MLANKNAYVFAVLHVIFDCHLCVLLTTAVREWSNQA